MNGQLEGGDNRQVIIVNLCAAKLHILLEISSAFALIIIIIITGT